MAESAPPRSLRERAQAHGGTLGTAALITAVTTGVVSVIAVLRQPSDPEVKARVDVLEADRIRRAVEAPGKEQADRALEDARMKELDRIRARVRDLEARCPPEPVDPKREPR